ncbi:trithorax group protein osa-like [Drosophila mauritiana]|uniref:Trithorax group protein osa-like n=1 Tax=Drosophila mauritiana TaxID=7226 RepID=A0A6P8JMR3_DROMA|nr:trithorax group protein osa-like [Drosophila mauritiana]
MNSHTTFDDGIVSLRNRAPSLTPLNHPKFSGGYANLVSMGPPTTELPQTQMIQDGQGQGQDASGAPENGGSEQISQSESERAESSTANSSFLRIQ